MSARAAAVAVAALLLVLASTATAAAHTKPVDSSPPAGAIVDVVPAQLSVTMSGRVDSALVRLTDGCGRDVPVEVLVAGREVVVSTVGTPGEASGRWRLDWTVVGRDGHPVVGGQDFSVSAGDRTGPCPAPSEMPSAPAGSGQPASEAASPEAATQQRPASSPAGAPRGAVATASRSRVPTAGLAAAVAMPLLVLVGLSSRGLTGRLSRRRSTR